MTSRAARNTGSRDASPMRRIQIAPSFPNFQELVLRSDLDCLALAPGDLGAAAVQLLTDCFEVGLQGIASKEAVAKLVAHLMALWPPPNTHTTSSPGQASSNSPGQAAFHLFAHGVDSLGAAAKLLHPTLCNGQRYLEKDECWAVAIACLGHCAGHGGRDNNFLILTENSLADRYLDKKPVEHHAASLVLTACRKHGILTVLEDQGRRARELIIETILFGDPGNHPVIVEKFEKFAERTVGITEAHKLVKDDRTLFATMILHAAVVSHPARSFKVARKWADALLTEFVSQGDELARLNLPVPPHMSRKIARAPILAVNYLDNFVIPSLSLLGGLIPRVRELVSETAKVNRDLFAQEYEQHSDGAVGGLIESAAAPNLAGSMGKFAAITMPEDRDPEVDPDGPGAELADTRGEDGDEGKRGFVATYCARLASSQKACGEMIEGGGWQTLSFAFTIMALFLDQIRDAFLPRSADPEVNALLFISFIFFCTEVVLMSYGIHKYFLNFFFWLDVAGTVSLILDIPFLFKALGLVAVSRQAGLLSGAKAARGARAARAAKMARLVRLIRLVRFVRLLKFVARIGKGAKTDENENDKAANDKPSRIGEILAEQMSQRVVIIVLLVLFIAPLLNAERSISFPLESTLSCMEYLPQERLTAFLNEKYLDIAADGNRANSNFNDVLYVMVNGQVQYKVDREVMREIRQSPTDDEVYTAYSANKAGCLPKPGSDCTLVKFDDRYYKQDEGVQGIYLILFMVFLLSFGSWLFVAISRRLVVAPIERMFKVIDIVSFSLNSLKNTEGEKREDDDDDAAFETSFLEEAVMKMADLLNMGYGAAGAEIIQRNLGLSEGATVETFTAGAKMDAVFAFCDIRKFTNSTEILQENVLRFVNLIGHIVHSNTVHYNGSPNKNIGDAFLLVWKFNTRQGRALKVNVATDDVFPGFSSSKDTAECKTIADGALKAMVQTAYDLHHINTMQVWELKRQLVALNILPPDEDQGAEEHELTKSDDKVIEGLIQSLVAAGRNIQMGYGLHFGWAIEGAIGSSMKIDASYLSPHVNTAARLEAATKQFGAPILMSGEFVEKLSDGNQQLCRKIDSVFLVGKAERTNLFTWDFWTGPDMTTNHAISELHLLTKKGSRSVKKEGGNPDESDPVVTPYEYCAKFEDGERAYEDGDWTRATSRLFECQKILKEDYPARSLIGVMSRYNYQAPSDWKGSRTLTEK